MSKRCELQKEYYQENENYKGSGKYNDNYVKWLEGKILEQKVVKNNNVLVDISKRVDSAEATVCEHKYDDLDIDCSTGRVICNNCHLRLE